MSIYFSTSQSSKGQHLAPRIIASEVLLQRKEVESQDLQVLIFSLNGFIFLSSLTFLFFLSSWLGCRVRVVGSEYLPYHQLPGSPGEGGVWVADCPLLEPKFKFGEQKPWGVGE